MRLAMLGLAVLVLLPLSVAAQDSENPKKRKRPKVDSVLVVVAKPKDEAIDDVVAAFMAAGLQVTNTTGSIVEAALGRKMGLLATYDRTTRAIITPDASGGSRVLIVTEEHQYTDASDIRMNRPSRVKRLDNKAGEDGGRIWLRMVRAGQQLDPALDTTDLILPPKQTTNKNFPD